MENENKTKGNLKTADNFYLLIYKRVINSSVVVPVALTILNESSFKVRTSSVMDK